MKRRTMMKTSIGAAISLIGGLFAGRQAKAGVAKINHDRPLISVSKPKKWRVLRDNPTRLEWEIGNNLYLRKWDDGDERYSGDNAYVLLRIHGVERHCTVPFACLPINVYVKSQVVDAIHFFPLNTGRECGEARIELHRIGRELQLTKGEEQIYEAMHEALKRRQEDLRTPEERALHKQLSKLQLGMFARKT